MIGALAAAMTARSAGGCEWKISDEEKTLGILREERDLERERGSFEEREGVGK